MIEQLWNDPIGEASMAKYLEPLQLNVGQNVLDVGCGCGEVLIRLCERYHVQGTGIDSSAAHIAEARRRAKGRVSPSALQFVEADAQSFLVAPGSLHAAICMGSSHAYGLGGGAYRNALQRMIPLVAAGGLLLVGEGYMKQPAVPEYRKLLGDSMPDEMTHAANVATGNQVGLIPMGAWTSTIAEWDDFEWSYQRIVERDADTKPNDPDVMTKLVRRREWMDAYLKWGRDTLGYGVYLFRKPK